MPKHLKVNQNKHHRHWRLLGALIAVTAVVLAVTLLLIPKRRTTTVEPAIPRGATLASWSENGQGGQYVLQVVEGGVPPLGVTVSGVVVSDAACQPDALGFNHCHNGIRVANGNLVTVVNTHVMMRYRCLRPGERIFLSRINASWVLGKMS